LPSRCLRVQATKRNGETASEEYWLHHKFKVYGGSPIKLLAQLMDQKRIPEKELARMRELLRKKRKAN